MYCLFSTFATACLAARLPSFVLLSASLVALQLPAAEHDFKAIHSVEGVTEYRLDNGLKILLIPDASVPTLSINVIIRTGSRQERYGEKGLAHLLEHLQFKGTPRFPNVPETMSISGWRMAAYTWNDFTSYQATMAGTTDNLERIIQFEADRFTNTLLTAVHLAEELHVVYNENENAKTSGANVLTERMIANAFEWHNYGNATIGNYADLNNVSLDTVQKFYKTFYRPGNATLVFAGRFDERQALETSQKYFGAIPRPDQPMPKEYTVEPPQSGERLVTVRGTVGVPVAAVFYHTPGGAHSDFAAVEVLVSALMATTPGYLWSPKRARSSGPLDKAMVGHGKARQLWGRLSGLKQRGHVEFYAELPRGTDPHPTLQELINAVEDVATGDLTENTIESAKLRLARRTQQQLTNLETLAFELRYWESLGDWRLLFLHRDRVKQVSVDDVQRVARQYLQRSNRTAGLYFPSTTPAQVTIAQTPDVAEMLKEYEGGAAVAKGEFIEPDPLVVEARVIRKMLPSGMRVALLPKKTRGEFVQLRLTLRFADIDSLKDRAIALSLLPELITCVGAKAKARKLTRGASGVTSSFARAANASIVITMKSERKYLLHNLSKMGHLLREPQFSEADFETLKRKRIASLESSMSKPYSLADREVRRCAQPRETGDPQYVPTPAEELELVKATTFADVSTLYDDLRGATQVEIVAVGDFEPSAIVRQMEAVVGAWQSPQPMSALPQIEPQGLQSSPIEIQLDGSAAACLAGEMYLPVAIGHDDYVALLVAQRVWHLTRWMPRINLEKGLSHYYRFNFESLPNSRWSRLRVRATCNSKNLDKLSYAVRDAFDSLQTDPIRESEFARAKRNLSHVARSRYWSDAAIVSSLANSITWDRTFKYYADIDELIESLTLQDVQAAANKYLDFNNMVIAVAGDIPRSTRP